jgi:prepilin-type N-terminal cleavage/methylation domain-containing protein
MKKSCLPAGKKRHDEGFTLLEVVVAVVILGVAYVAVMQNLSLSTQNILRIQKSGESIFEQTLQLEGILLDPDETVLGDAEVYSKGTRLQLVVVNSEDSRLKTLKLIKIPL